MQKNIMTPRERWCAALRFEPVDCIPFWPKLDGAYAAAHAAASRMEEFQRWCHSDPQTGIGVSFSERTSRTAIRRHTDGNVTDFRYETPYGVMTARHVYDEASCSSHPTEFPVKTRDDLRRMTAVYEDTQVDYDAAAHEKAVAACAAVGETAVVATFMGESPLMLFVEFLAGVENAHYLMADCPEEVGALFHAMHRVLKEKVAITADRSPADTLYLVENTSTTLISPEQYRQYCKPFITEYLSMARDAGRFSLLHMCGHLKALLPDLAEVGASAFEAFTSPPVGNTTLHDGRLACPKVCLIGGTNAALWMRDDSSALIVQLEHDLAELPHRRGLVISSAGIMPRLCSPDTIRRVGEWVHSLSV